MKKSDLKFEKLTDALFHLSLCSDKEIEGILNRLKREPSKNAYHGTFIKALEACMVELINDAKEEEIWVK